MTDFAATLESIEHQLAVSVATALGDGVLTDADDAAVLGVLSRAAGIVRLAEAVIVEATGVVQDRSASPVRAERVTVRAGCGTVSELLQRATRASRHAANGYERAARAVHRPVSITSGDLLPAEYPAMREAMVAGTVGVDGLTAVLGPLSGVPAAAGRAAFLAADAELAASARGEGVGGEPPACADDLRLQAQVWAVHLDQDGAEPREARAQRKRGVTFGQAHEGVVPVRGNLLADVAAQFQTLCDAVLNPKLSGPRFAEESVGECGDQSVAPRDPRTRAQKQHDVLATVLSIAAASGDLPEIGGAAPTLVVTVRAEDYAKGRGYAHAQGCDEPVALSVARQLACGGRVQRVVLGEGGRIVALGTSGRIFNRAQRRAIRARDGECVIPGCHVPAAWCEIHHVDDHARGGPTHTDNGVPLCWWHHRTLETSGWEIRMRDGVPEIRGPSWWDPGRPWRLVTASAPRLLDRLERRRT